MLSSAINDMTQINTKENANSAPCSNNLHIYQLINSNILYCINTINNSTYKAHLSPCIPTLKLNEVREKSVR